MEMSGDVSMVRKFTEVDRLVLPDESSIQSSAWGCIKSSERFKEFHRMARAEIETRTTSSKPIPTGMSSSISSLSSTQDGKSGLETRDDLIKILSDLTQAGTN
ncbi:hypothetical protein PoB_005030000 [Plakobranchus ocellatus]|uniref:Uncharacterized protein n=1 Tax=Plakobranchus ocellatus TaxID=259542 RepID=A0AAV4BWT5_9GAST|nr:hypothetical protein PoB_005030000 [Plakobranchus ocellatus]